MKKLAITNVVLFAILLAVLPKLTFEPRQSRGTIYQSYAVYSIVQAAVLALIFVITIVVAIVRLLMSSDNNTATATKTFVSTLLPVVVIILTIDNLYFIYRVIAS